VTRDVVIVAGGIAGLSAAWRLRHRDAVVTSKLKSPGAGLVDGGRKLLGPGHDIEARLPTAQLQACSCAPDPTALHAIVLPSTHDGLTCAARASP
jgi:predicted NAD/FAD-dependent oxidoreductase